MLNDETDKTTYGISNFQQIAVFYKEICVQIDFFEK